VYAKLLVLKTRTHARAGLSLKMQKEGKERKERKAVREEKEMIYEEN
jgi:hypothetical protein